jgi:3-oxoacyl-[acyl-carrier protein] reductase
LKPTLRLANKFVVVTGAGQGLGKAYAMALAKEGASVAIGDINRESAKRAAEEIQQSGGKSLSIELDVSDEKSVNNAMNSVAKEFGSIDVLINNAALQPRRKSFAEISVQEWDRMMDVNLKGSWLTAKAAFPFMQKRGKGKIINVTSTLAIKGGSGELHYAASKAGVIALTRTLAQELGPYNISVNAIGPGLTATETTEQNYDRAVFDRVTSIRCFKRVEHPSDVVGTVLFLCSDESDFITGQTIIVSGGDYFN